MRCWPGKSSPFATLSRAARVGHRRPGRRVHGTPDTDTAARAARTRWLPLDPVAAVEELQRRREEIGFSYVVIGADFADTFAPVVAELAGH